MKVYLDNNTVSARTRQDLKTPEQEALNKLLAPPYEERTEVVTSRESWREQERTKHAQLRKRLKNARTDTKIVANDHRILGFSHQADQLGGFITYPLVDDIVDENIFTWLRNKGLEKDDARHLMYALCNACDVFLTTDDDFLNLRESLAAQYPTIRIRNPAELLSELDNALPNG